MTDTGGRPALHIQFVTQWFDPEPAFRGLDFVHQLQDLGHHVEVLTGTPNYPTGRTYDGFSAFGTSTAVVDGVQIRRLPLYPSHDRNPFRRIANYVSFAASVFLAQLVRPPEADLVYVYSPPPTVGLAVLTAQLVRKSVPVLVEVQDLWPDSVVASGMAPPPILGRPLRSVCNWVYRGASTVIAQSNGISQALIQRGIQPGDVHVVRNWAPEEQLLSSIASQAPPERTLREVLFAGTFGEFQRLETVIHAAKRLSELSAPVEFVLLGDGSMRPELERSVQLAGLTNVRFEDRIPRSEVPARMARSDFLLLSLDQGVLGEITIPSKLQTYLCAGRPILAGLVGESSDLIKDSGGGLCFDPRDPQSLVEAVEQLCAMTPEDRSEMGRAGSLYYTRHLSRDIGVAKINRAIHETAGKRDR